MSSILIFDSVKRFIIELTLKDISNILEDTEFSKIVKLQIDHKKISISNYKLTDIQGIGRNAQKQLHKLQIFTIKDLLDFDIELNKSKLNSVTQVSDTKISNWKKKAQNLLNQNNLDI